MNIDAIRQIPLVDFLNHLGYRPTGRDSKGLWFYSPYRNERSPRSMSTRAKIYGSILGAVQVATSSTLPES